MVEDLILQYGTPDSLLGPALIALALLIEGSSRVRSFLEGDDDQVESDDVLEDLRSDYVDGEISIEEFERRVGLALDDDARELRDRVESINGIGPETSAAIAESFGDVDAIEDASRDDLEDVRGIGPETSAAIRERF